MRTSISIIILLLSYTINAQSGIAFVDTHTNNETVKKGSGTLSVSDFTLKIYNDDTFDIHQLLRDAKKSNRNYRVENRLYSEYELVQIFKKGTRTTDSVEAFEAYLSDIQPELLQRISEREAVSIFEKFREGSFRVYLDGLSSAF